MTIKTCYRCTETKGVKHFSKDSSRKDGLNNTCKACDSARLAGRRSSHTVAHNAARDCAQYARRRSDLSSFDLYGGLTYTQAHAMTLPFIEERLRLEADTGVAHHIDHIIPIAAGGTHTKDNLQVLTAQENIEKGATE